VPQLPTGVFRLTIKAFNFSEDFRVPVMFMLDEVVCPMAEKVVIPPADRN
jgi:2-oxoglutarate ferredoxin oxidoreductase subunit alpha